MNYLFDEETKQQLRQTVNDPKLIRLLDMTKDELSKIELTHVSLESYDNSVAISFLHNNPEKLRELLYKFSHYQSRYYEDILNAYVFGESLFNKTTLNDFMILLSIYDCLNIKLFLTPQEYLFAYLVNYFADNQGLQKAKFKTIGKVKQYFRQAENDGKEINIKDYLNGDYKEMLFHDNYKRIKISVDNYLNKFIISLPIVFYKFGHYKFVSSVPALLSVENSNSEEQAYIPLNIWLQVVNEKLKNTRKAIFSKSDDIQDAVHFTHDDMKQILAINNFERQISIPNLYDFNFDNGTLVAYTNDEQPVINEQDDDMSSNELHDFAWIKRTPNKYELSSKKTDSYIVEQFPTTLYVMAQ